MAILVVLQGPEVGRKFTLEGSNITVGRQFDCQVTLTGRQISRQHARIMQDLAGYTIEDLASSNGTFLNGQRVAPHKPTPFTERDTLQIGPYLLALRPAPTPATTEANLVVRESISVITPKQSVYAQDPALKLQVVLEIAQVLARTLDLEPLLDKLLQHLVRLFPQADRAMVLLCEGDDLVVRGQRCRRSEDDEIHPYSRTIVRRALDEGVGILSEDVHADQRFEASSTLTGLDLHSLLCVPLIGQDGQRLGVIQVDRFRRGLPFRVEDLQLLTTVCMLVSVVLENASLHAERLREERLHRDLALAREIQQGFLPTELEGFPSPSFDIFGKVFPARQVAGDLYDFMAVDGGKLAFFLGDVSGKGMPAALFMVAVRTLTRHLASAAENPSTALAKLNAALSLDNTSGMFVTLAHGLYEPETGAMLLASGGHPPPLLRHADGQVDEVAVVPGRLLGYEHGELHLNDLHFTLPPGGLLVFYTDGVSEAREPEAKKMFGVEGLSKVVADLNPSATLEACADRIRAAIEAHTKTAELQDDLTLLLLRRK